MRWLLKRLPARYLLGAQLALVVVGAHLAIWLLWTLMGYFAYVSKKHIQVTSRRHAVIVSIARRAASQSPSNRAAPLNNAFSGAGAKQTIQQAATQLPKQARIPSLVKGDKKQPAKAEVVPQQEVHINQFQIAQRLMSKRQVEPQNTKKRAKPIPLHHAQLVNNLARIEVGLADDLEQLVEQTELDAAELLELERTSSISATIASVWRPPRAIIPTDTCIAEVTLDRKGRVLKIDMIRSSGVASYDASVRLALSQIAYPSWLWGETTSFTFGE